MEIVQQLKARYKKSVKNTIKFIKPMAEMVTSINNNQYIHYHASDLLEELEKPTAAEMVHFLDHCQRKENLKLL